MACPRLSIDWGRAFQDAPLLTAYEALVALSTYSPRLEVQEAVRESAGERKSSEDRRMKLRTVEWKDNYPMDFYHKGGGEWTNYYAEST